MKIEKSICDICGEEITESHPTRLEQQEYDKKDYRPHYKRVRTYDICKSCCAKLSDIFKGAQEVK